jgi:hypothetical protein
MKKITKDLQVGGNVESFDCVCTGGTSIRKQVLEKRSISGCSGKTVVKKKYNCENCSKDCEVNGHYRTYILVCCLKNCSSSSNLHPYIPLPEYDQELIKTNKVRPPSPSLSIPPPRSETPTFEPDKKPSPEKIIISSPKPFP